ncbi:MAG TPA: helix-turn-helix transcriptional regulator [Phycisphaerae bacterium]|nr:helix-turn-helix transcriptional regulator [Phycisphaerae bacterium]
MAKGKRENLSEQLRRFIRERGESLAQIGRETGVSHTALSRFLRHERGLSTASLDRLCKYLGVELRKVRRRKGA